MNRANPYRTFLHLFFTTVFMVLFVSIALAQGRTRGPGAGSGVFAGPIVSQHTYMGDARKLPAIITKRNWKKKGSRAPGDGGVTRQTTLISRQDPANLNSTTPTLAQEEHPFWTADEKYIYFDTDRVSATDSTENLAKVFNIYRTVSDGENPEQITAGTQQKIEPNVLNSLLAYVAGGTITPASSSDTPVTTGFNLFVLDMNNSSGQPVALTSGSTTFNFSDVRRPSWSPSGDFIVFSGQVGSGLPYHIYKVNYVTGLISQLTSGTSNDTSPAWSSDSNNIAFTSNASGFPATSVPIAASALNADGHTEIWTISANPTTPLPIQVTGFAAGGRSSSNKNPAWSSTKNDPLGLVPTQLIAFASSRGDSNHDGVADSVINPATFDIWYIQYTGAPAGGVDGAIKLQTSTPGTGIDLTDPAHIFDPNFTSNEDYPTWPQYINSYRMVYQSDRGGNLNLWSSTVVDLNAPTLLSYDSTTREIVHVGLDSSPDVSVREVAAGSKVRFRVRMVDYESGVGQVYIQIKNPNSAQQENGLEHKIFFPEDTLIEGTGGAYTLLLNVPRELDCQAINSGNYTYRPPAVIIGGGFFSQNSTNTTNPWPGFNKYVASANDTQAFSGSFLTPDAVPGSPGTSFWLKLSEIVGTPGVYEAVWTTPTEQSDWYIDVIGYDNAVDPFDPISKWNWKIYDNVWGFTTKPFQSQNHILYVNDYDSGQKFFDSRFNTGLFFGGNVGYTGVPTESWMTEISDSLTPTNYQKWSGTPLKDTEDGVFLNTRQTMGLEGIILDINNGPVPAPANQDNYDMWRILSRGPVPVNVLQLYGASQETEPAPTVGGAPIKHTIANGYVLWHSPYSGDLFVGPGTITDTTTQLNLASFYKSGGRFFLDGQDVAFALSAGGGLGSSFLKDILGVNYVGDFTDALYPAGVNTTITLKKVRGDNPISTLAWYTDPGFIFFDHGYLGETGEATPSDNTYPSTSGQVYIGDAPGGARFTEYSALNQKSTDVVSFTFAATIPPAGSNPLPFGVDGSYAGLNTPAIMYNSVTDANAPIGKVVYSPFGWESIQNQFWAPKGSKKTYQNKNTRSELIHNLGDFLRTGTLVGTVRSATGAGGSSSPSPLGGALVTAERRGVVRGSAITLSDGSFSMRGLESDGEYDVFAKKTNFSGDANGGNHVGVQVGSFHGGGSTRVDLFLYAVAPGSISGKITAFGTGTPVAGAVVQATDNANPGNIFTGTSGADGTYSISGVPGGTYTLIVTAASMTALQFSGSIPVSYPSVVVTNQANIAGQDFQLKPLQGHLKGKVTKGDISGVDTGVPLAGATVTATSSVGGTAIPPVVTDASGNYVLPLDPGSYTIVVTAPGFLASNPTPVTIKTNTDTVQNFVLTALAPGTLVGRVESTNHAAIVGATVLVYDANGSPILDGSGIQIQGTTVAALTGNNYRIINVPAGAVVHVTAKKTGYKGLNGLAETDFAAPAPTVTPSPPLAPVDTQVPTLTLDPLHVFLSTLSLVSSPYDYNSSPVTLFSIPAGDITNGSFIMATWNGTKYITYPTSPADTFHRGVGYFLQEPNVTLALTTIENPLTPTQLTTPLNIALKPGWNLIGDPFPFSINFLSLKIQDATGATTDVATAQSGSNPVLGAAMWTYDSGAYQIAYTLDQWRGYWVRAFAPVTLIVDPAAQQPRSAKNPLDTRGVLFTNSTGLGWRVELHAIAGTVRSAPGTLGVHRSASNGYDKFKLESPPPAGTQTVNLSFNHDDWALQSGKYSVDVRSAQSPTNSWDFTVTSNIANTPVSLSWPGIATVPAKQALTLTDMDTHTTINMRNQLGYSIPGASTGNVLRHFRVEAKRATRQNLAVIDVVAHVNPSQSGRAPASAGISYTLTSDATVQVNILSNGRSIRTITSAQSRAAGSTDLLWDLKNEQGVTVSGNLYTVEIRATDTQGRLVRRIVPLLIAR